MNCTRCRSSQTRVVNSRPQGKTVWRRRRCLRCSNRFTTWEITEDYKTDIDQRLQRLDQIIAAVEETQRSFHNDNDSRI